MGRALAAAIWLPPLLRFALGLRVQVMVTSEWANVHFRLYLRRALESCAPLLPAGHAVESHFFMGLPDGPQAELDAAQEAKVFQDLVLVGGPDGDETTTEGLDGLLNISQEPSARALRILRAMVWLLRERTELEYVVHMQDTSFIHLPRLMGFIEANQDPLLVLGRVATDTPLIYGGLEEGELPCETCHLDPLHERICIDHTRKSPGGMEFRGCILAARRCCAGAAGEGAGCTAEQLTECISTAQSTAFAAAVYFGASFAPRWPHGAGWAVGRGVAEFLAHNAEDLKTRGRFDLLLGFWLAGLEDVRFVDISGLVASDPGAGSPTDSEGVHRCKFAESHAGSLVVSSGLSTSDWANHFDSDMCEMRCD